MADITPAPDDVCAYLEVLRNETHIRAEQAYEQWRVLEGSKRVGRGIWRRLWRMRWDMTINVGSVQSLAGCTDDSSWVDEFEAEAEEKIRD